MISALQKYQDSYFCDLSLLKSFGEATQLPIHWLDF